MEDFNPYMEAHNGKMENFSPNMDFPNQDMEIPPLCMEELQPSMQFLNKDKELHNPSLQSILYIRPQYHIFLCIKNLNYSFQFSFW